MEKLSERFKTYTELEKIYLKILSRRLPRRKLRKVLEKYVHITLLLTGQASG